MEINKENQNKKRLGRGLGSLLGGPEQDGDAFVVTKTNSAAETIRSNEKNTTVGGFLSAESNSQESRVWSIAIDKLVPGIYQPRKNFNKESLQELSNSIKENGIIQPITVRKRDAGGFEILAGERRWRAAQMAGLHEVPAIIKQIADREALQIALIENVQREDLDPIEEAESYQRLMDEFSLSQQEVAEKVGKERSTVANALRLQALPFEIKEMITKKQITVGHAKVLLAVTNQAAQTSLARKVLEKGLSVRGLEQEVKLAATTSERSVATKQNAVGLNIDLAAKLATELADQLQKALGTKVEISYKRGKGSIQVHFYTDDQLTQIYEKLKS